jgi:hypothetical protein
VRAGIVAVGCLAAVSASAESRQGESVVVREDEQVSGNLYVAKGGSRSPAGSMVNLIVAGGEVFGMDAPVVQALSAGELRLFGGPSTAIRSERSALQEPELDTRCAADPPKELRTPWYLARCVRRCPHR